MNIYKICKIIFINILFFIFLIIVIELILGNKIYKKKLKCEYLLCSVNLTYKNDLYSGTKNINYIKDRYGFRGLRKNVNEIDRKANLDTSIIRSLIVKYKKLDTENEFFKKSK